MAWTRLLYTKGQVDAAGRVLAPRLGYTDDNEPTDEQWEQTFAVINNWRSAHSYPLLATRMTLTTRARKLDARAVVAQRLKRLTSIQTKLWRNQNMALSQMQDIGGCRAVLRTVSRVDRLVESYEDVFAKNPNVRAEFVRKYDYIARPKKDGYRSVHFVIKYRTKSRHLRAWNGLRVEIQ
jgi:ppGpp synthetase/RelA/SpoT-type nucleotidyltranferase